MVRDEKRVISGETTRRIKPDIRYVLGSSHISGGEIVNGSG
jgi:hypothetical protein